MGSLTTREDIRMTSGFRSLEASLAGADAEGADVEVGVVGLEARATRDQTTRSLTSICTRWLTTPEAETTRLTACKIFRLRSQTLPKNSDDNTALAIIPSGPHNRVNDVRSVCEQTSQILRCARVIVISSIPRVLPCRTTNSRKASQPYADSRKKTDNPTESSIISLRHLRNMAAQEFSWQHFRGRQANNQDGASLFIPISSGHSSAMQFNQVPYD